MARPFVPWPDPRLKRVAEEVGEITDEIRAIWDEMIEAMRTMPAGVGLAAPQLGINLRLAIVDAGDGKALVKLANPEIVQASKETTLYDEGSPNLPGVSAKVKRPASVTVSFIDHMGVRVRQDFTGLWARSVQHQIDHLNGKMYFDRLSRVKRDMLIRKARKCA